MRLPLTFSGGDILTYTLEGRNTKIAHREFFVKPSEIFRKNSAALMKKLGWNKAELARASGNFDSVVGRYLSGANIPTIDAVESIARALGVSVGELLTDDDAHIENIRHVLMTPEQIAEEVKLALKQARVMLAEGQKLAEETGEQARKNADLLEAASQIVKRERAIAELSSPALHKIRRRIKKS